MSETIVIPEFDLERKKVAIKLRSKAGEPKFYALVEFDGAERDAYLNTLNPRMKIDANTGKPVGIRDFKDMQADLIAGCLYEVKEMDEDGVTPKEIADKPVPKEFIRKLPATASAAINKLCRELNALDKEAEDKEKKADG